MNPVCDGACLLDVCLQCSWDKMTKANKFREEKGLKIDMDLVKKNRSYVCHKTCDNDHGLEESLCLPCILKANKKVYDANEL